MIGEWGTLWEAEAFFGAPSRDQIWIVVGANVSQLIHFTQLVLKRGTKLDTCWTLGHRDGDTALLDTVGVDHVLQNSKGLLRDAGLRKGEAKQLVASPNLLTATRAVTLFMSWGSM